VIHITKDKRLHNNTASLLQLAQHPRQYRIDDLLNLILVTLLLLLVLMRLLVVLLLMSMSMRRFGRKTIRRAASKIDIDSAFILLRRILQAQLATDLLHARLDLLNMVRGMVSLANNPRSPCQSAYHSKSHP
jgi:hypothetical protein